MAKISAFQQAKDMVGKLKGNIQGAFQPGGRFGPLISPLPDGGFIPQQTTGQERWRVDEKGNTVPRFANGGVPGNVPTPTPTPQQVAQTYGFGGISRNPNAKNFNISQQVVDAINNAAKVYGIPASILGDIALQESSFDPSKTAAMGGYDGKTIDPSTGKPRPYSTSQGLFMFNDPTWQTVQNYQNMKGSSLKLPNNNRLDPNTAALAAAYLIKYGQLGRWSPSANVWAPNYNYDELSPYFSQTQQSEIPARTLFRQ